MSEHINYAECYCVYLNAVRDNKSLGSTPCNVLRANVNKLFIV